MSEIKRKNPYSFENIIKEYFDGKSVMTFYNKRFYRVEDVDFTITANDTFTNDKDVHVSFVTYYKEKYNIDIYAKDQPLLKITDKKTKK